ncbi:MAG: hypothetical protein HXY25_11090, partial [Alphaproteobacteria bacterium]|nr:hypothetical protein [Alphaproteobacteria bacterium]
PAGGAPERGPPVGAPADTGGLASSIWITGLLLLVGLLLLFFGVVKA